MSRWTTADMPDCHGKRAIVTGANKGLGFEVALELARRGTSVTLACRDVDRGEQALRRIQDEVTGADIDLGILDLADLESVGAFSDDYRDRHDGLDLLINNAGVMAFPHRMTPDAFELQIGTNHLGHFALTGLLLPLLNARPGARVVTVTSLAHRHGQIRFGNLHGRFRYRRWHAYHQSKLANAIFTMELHRRLVRAGLPTTSVAAHPGYAATDLLLAAPRLENRRIAETLFRLTNSAIAQPVAAGALPLLYAATAPGVLGGSAYGPLGIRQMRGRPGQVSLAGQAYDTGLGQHLWEMSERLTEVTYDFAQRPADDRVLTPIVPMQRPAVEDDGRIAGHVIGENSDGETIPGYLPEWRTAT